MTEWFLVVSIIWAVGYKEPDWAENNMMWPMPSHEACINTAKKLFPRDAGNQMQLATCVKRGPPPSEWSFPTPE